jgi:putative peptidoglycan lipid II flippase
MSIFRASAVFGIITILTQVLGVVRDVLLARFVGVGPVLDVYYMAFKIPDLLNGFYIIFLGSVIFIPIITKARKSGGEHAVARR